MGRLEHQVKSLARREIRSSGIGLSNISLAGSLLKTARLSRDVDFVPNREYNWYFKRSAGGQ